MTMTVLYHSCGYTQTIKVQRGRKPLRLQRRCPNCNGTMTNRSIYTGPEWDRMIAAIEHDGTIKEILEPNAEAMALMARREAEAAASAPVFKVYDSCGCLPTVHKGPHWLHMVMLDRQRLSGLWESGNALGFLSEAGPAYRNMEYEMRAAGMTEQESIWAFLQRTGWDPRLIMELRAKYNARKA